MAIWGDGLEIGTNKMSIIMEVDMVALEAEGAREAVAKCKETMIQVVVLNAIIVKNHAI